MSLNMHTPESGPHQSVSYDGKIAGLYDLEKTLGSGHFAVVKLARHVFTGEKVAVKVVDKTKLDEVSKAHLFQEVRCMKLVQHPNVVRLYEVIDTQTKLYLILELGDGGDLYDYIMKHEGGLSEDLARKYFRQIVRAISYCHQLHVVHRDLKPANVVFFEKQGVVKLTDFGFSNKFSPGQKLETSCGSLAYSAPEILLGDSYDAPAVDIWSLGVILYMLVYGQPPFEKANDSETLTMIMDCKYTMPSHVTVTCRRLIASMLVRDPEKRATLDQIAQDVWLKQNVGVEPLSDHLPLVSREQVSEDDHALIVQKMINGNIATKDEILHSLDRNKYNHITATYFLLAERRLRQKRQDQVQKHRPQIFLSSHPTARNSNLNRNVPIDNKAKGDGSKLMIPINIEVCNSIEFSTEVASEKRNRKCSIVREEDEEETCEYTDKTELCVNTNCRSSVSDTKISRAVQERSLDTQYMSKLFIKPKNINVKGSERTIEPLDGHPSECSPDTEASKDSTSQIATKVTSGKSEYSNALPVQQRVQLKIPPINEHQEGGGINELNLVDGQQYISGIKDLEITKIRNKNPVLMHRRTKLNKMRTPSCSSSEASDDETKSRKKKIHKIVGDAPNRFKVYRRDSHDDSSDSQDQSTLNSSQNNKPNLLNNTNNGKTTCDKKGQSKSEESQNSKQNSSSLTENSLLKVSGRRRLRESHSLDRITESQEYEQRQKLNFASHDLNESTYVAAQLCNLSLASNNCNNISERTLRLDKVIYSKKESLKNEAKSQALKNMYGMNSFEDINIYIGMNVTKAIDTGTKCSATLKKIRRLGKYFPVVNLS